LKYVDSSEEALVVSVSEPVIENLLDLQIKRNLSHGKSILLLLKVIFLQSVNIGVLCIAKFIFHNCGHLLTLLHAVVYSPVGAAVVLMTIGAPHMLVLNCDVI
jgi:hypothetical protein